MDEDILDEVALEEEVSADDEEDDL
jgi:hypothetical protein